MVLLSGESYYLPVSYWPKFTVPQTRLQPTSQINCQYANEAEIDVSKKVLRSNFSSKSIYFEPWVEIKGRV